eukprot:3913314-Ditylum_brightwellii.AAC.1
MLPSDGNAQDFILLNVENKWGKLCSFKEKKEHIENAKYSLSLRIHGVLVARLEKNTNVICPPKG